MKTWQETLVLRVKSRGVHLITGEIEGALQALPQVRVGTAHIFLQHTSASLSLGENADPTVRSDMEDFLTDLVDHKPYYRHTYEGPDDMPAHIKSSLLGASLTLPVTNGRLNLGTWQGIYLCEHRDHPASRQVVVTLSGEEA